MKQIIKSSFVDVLGEIWLPYGARASLRVNLSSYDVENMRGEDGSIGREDVDRWLSTHSGDFSRVIDFSASIEDGEATLDFPWSSEENECSYFDTLSIDE